MGSTILTRQGATLVAPTELTIHLVEALKTELVDALRRGEDVTIALDAVRQVDTAALQLLVSARRTAAAGGRQVALEHPSEAMRGAVRRLGLEHALFGQAL